METMGFAFGILGFIFASNALVRIGNLEKKLKLFDVIPRDFDSERDQKEGDAE